MAAEDQMDSGSEVVTFTVSNARAIDSRSLFALVDVEVQAGGIVCSIRGVQARRIPDGGTSVHLPTYKDSNGTWQPAITMPEELRGPLADAVLQFLVEEGLARFKYLPAARQGAPSARSGLCGTGEGADG